MYIIKIIILSCLYLIRHIKKEVSDISQSRKYLNRIPLSWTSCDFSNKHTVRSVDVKIHTGDDGCILNLCRQCLYRRKSELKMPLSCTKCGFTQIKFMLSSDSFIDGKMNVKIMGYYLWCFLQLHNCELLSGTKCDLYPWGYVHNKNCTMWDKWVIVKFTTSKWM